VVGPNELLINYVAPDVVRNICFFYKASWWLVNVVSWTKTIS